MRVLWLSPWLRPFAEVVSESLQRSGTEVMLITSNRHPESGAVRDYETVLDGRPIPTKDWIQIPRAYAQARHFQPDVVVTEILSDPRWRIFGSLAPRICLRHDARRHDETHVRRLWHRSFDRWDSSADGTIVFSEYVAECLREMNYGPSPVHVMAPLVTDLDPTKVPRFVDAARRKNFVLVGRQRPYKNHHVVFEAWAKHTEGPSWLGDELVLFGEGELASPLPKHASWRRQQFRYEEVSGELSRAKGSVVHYRNASQSGVQVMSMQLGVAPLVSTAGALPEYQPAGLPISGVDDVWELARSFDALADPAEAERQGKIALEHYRTHFSPEAAAERMLEICSRVAGRL